LARINILSLGEAESFGPIRFLFEKPNLARIALDVLAVLMSDECEKLFSSAKLLLTDRLSRLRMDIIEVCECLCAWYDPPPTKRLKRQQTSAKWIRGHMSLIVLTAHIVVIGNMEILMEICSRNRYVLLT
jgi:hypothetical protein